MARETSRTGPKYYYRNATPVTAAPYTLSVWFYSTNRSTNQNLFCLNRQGAATDSAGLGLVPSPSSATLNFFSTAGGVNAASAASSNTYSLDSWQHACGVAASATDRKSYLNGDTANKGTSTTNSAPSSLNRVSIGVWFGQAPFDQLNGGLAECAIWDVALTEPEVVSLSKGMSASRIRPQNLKFYFPGIRNVVDLKDAAAMISVGTPGVIAHPRIY